MSSVFYFIELVLFNCICLNNFQNFFILLEKEKEKKQKNSEGWNDSASENNSFKKLEYFTVIVPNRLSWH